MTAAIPAQATAVQRVPADDLPHLVAHALAALDAGRADRTGPLPAGGPPAVEAAVDAALGGDVLPDAGVGELAALRDLVRVLAAGAADPADPACAGHLHCPPLPVAVAADLAASALNQSLDSWDQAPAATVLEQRTVAALAGLAGLPGGGGVLTTGGTASTYTAMLLARDATLGPVRVYASALAHFSVERGAHLLGLPPVVAVPVAPDGRMDVPALATALAAAPAGERPLVVATAGSTDLGAIDPLPELARLVRPAGGWLHVDAAYGGGLLFSDRARHLLAGIEDADSVGLDLHKLGWQPAAAGVLLTRRPEAFTPLERRAAYLNPADDEALGYASLLGRSLRTTRRADVLKVAVTLRALGRQGLGERVDTCLELARHAARRVRDEPALLLHAEPVLTTVVFRYRTADPAQSDAVNAALRRRLLQEGRAVVGRTEMGGSVHLKLTLLNPGARHHDIDALLAAVVAAGRAEEETAVAARAARHALTVLLRCWLREAGTPVPGPGPLRVELPATGRALVVAVTRRSPSGAHHLADARSEDGAPLDLGAVAALLTAEAAARAGLHPDRGGDACARITESARRASGYAAARGTDPAPPAGLPTWLAAEQDLLAGHPWHPMTKSRDGLPDTEDSAYAPEARGRFRLHWYGVAPAALTTGSVGGLDVRALLHHLAGPDLAVPPGFVPVPAHPWQAARLADRPGAAALLAAGHLLDLGPAGDPWWATSSLRTVARPEAPVMLKLSLGLRVTNSRRENLRAELALATRTAALVDAGLGAALAATHPQFRFVRDPAWAGVDPPDRALGPVGLDTVIREQPFASSDRVACAGALVDARPDRGRPVAADLVAALSARRGLTMPQATAAWFRAWLDAVAVPLLWLHGTWGIGLEAHLQNVLVGLDADGVPARGWYRDNQGWYAAASRVDRVEALLPAVGQGVPLVYDDDLVTDRVAYYLGVNHLLGAAAALAGAGLTAEEDLLRVLVDVLRAHSRGPDPSPVAALLLEADTLPVKANLLTGVDGRDELDGPVDAQSVYVDVPNPLREVQP